MCGVSVAQVAGPPPDQPAAPEPTATAAAPAATPPSRADAFAEFRRLFDQKQYQEAAAAAQTVVDLTNPKTGTGGEELQVALMNLATAQYYAGDYLGSETSYLRVIELIEATGRMTNPRLARANAGLARTYHAAKRHELAVARFERAIALSRRGEGLFNEEQLPLLEDYADSLSALDRMQEALQARRYALRIVERRHGAGSLQYAHELESIGRWYARSGAYDASRMSLRRAIEIIEATQGPGSPLLVGPLAGLADCARRQLLDPSQQALASADYDRSSLFHDPSVPAPASVSPSTIAADGQKALERAVEIASNRPDPSPAQVADIRTQLGDWFEWRQQPDKALPQYQQAWLAASRADVDGKPLSEALYGRPVLLYYTWPESWDRYRARPATEAELRNVELELTVNPQGRVQDVKVVADAGDPKLAGQAIRAAETARYRPRMENGQPVATPGVRFSQPFYVLLPPVPAPAGDKPAK